MTNGDAPPHALSVEQELVGWRRDADYWQKRIERSDDQAAGVLAACLTVGGVGAAAAGYVQDRAPNLTSAVIVGLSLVVFAGLLTMGSRTFLPGCLGLLWDGPANDRGHVGPEEATTLQKLVAIEEDNAHTRGSVARWRERLVGLAFIVWAAGVILVACAGLKAL